VLDLIRSWRAPNLSTLQGMAPVHASKAARRGLRLDHLFNQRDGPQGAIARLETDLADYWGALAHQKLSEATLLELARSNTKIQVPLSVRWAQAHVLGFIEAVDCS
jgi:adenylosuccinate synthase